MSKRTLGMLLAIAILTAPVVAAVPQAQRVEQQPTWIEKVWGELKELLWDGGPRQRQEIRGEKAPPRMSAADEGSQGHDPDG